MHRLAVVVLALAAVSIEARPHGEEVELPCSGLQDGYYADPSDRAAFFSCFEGNLVAKVVCEEGFEFDGIEDCVQVQEDNVETQEAQEDEVAETEEVQEETFDSEELQGGIAEYLKDFSESNLQGDDAEDDSYRYAPNSNNTSVPKIVFNLEITRNIFPKSFIYVERMNREQKNK